jgi:site-specific DNA-methyltransferase (adenine-specific)
MSSVMSINTMNVIVNVPSEKKMGYMPKSKSDKWMTPPEVYEPLNKEFKFNFDPCPIDWKEGDPDGLKITWGSSTFCNPPYSKTAQWIKKAHDEWKNGKTVVMLINVVTDTIAFHEYIYNKAEIRFIKGRVKFINQLDPTNRNPNVKPSMIVIFRH